MTTLEAYDALRFAEQYEHRLLAADALLAGKRGLATEKDWVATAMQLLQEARAGVPALLERCRHLPELDEVRDEFALNHQHAWVDALEKLHGGITFHATARAPILEALFPHVKWPLLRKGSREDVAAYQKELERRLRTGYVTRILSGDDYAFAGPVVQQVSDAYATWVASFEPQALSDAEAAPLRQELVRVGRRVERVTQQARLLAEAALVPLPEGAETAGLGLRPRRRAPRLEGAELLPGEGGEDPAVEDWVPEDGPPRAGTPRIVRGPGGEAIAGGPDEALPSPAALDVGGADADADEEAAVHDAESAPALEDALPEDFAEEAEDVDAAEAAPAKAGRGRKAGEATPSGPRSARTKDAAAAPDAAEAARTPTAKEPAAAGKRGRRDDAAEAAPDGDASPRGKRKRA